MLIQDQAIKKAVLHAMADDCSVAILRSATDTACSAAKLVHDFAFPQSTVYRRINELVNSGLLVVERIVVDKDGKKFSLYRTTVKDIRAEYRNGQIEIELSLNDDAASKLLRLWDSVRTQ